MAEIIHIPTYSNVIRQTTVYPHVIKVLENGVEIIDYHWQVAELAEIVSPGEPTLPDHYFLGYGKLWGNNT